MRKKLLSALLSMCMMLTMLPMSAFAADETADAKVPWDTDNVYTLTEDTTYETIDTNADGEKDTYAINLDTYTLSVDTVNVGKDSFLSIKDKKDAKGSVKAATSKDGVRFVLDGTLTTEYVIFEDTVTVSASEATPAPASFAARAATPTSSVLSGTFKDGLIIEKDAVVTLKDATVTGDITVKGELTVSGAVEVTGSLKVEGKLTIADDASVTGKIEGEGDIIAPSGYTPYTFEVTSGGHVDVYTVSEDTTSAVKVESGITTLSVKGDKTQMNFFPDSRYDLGDVKLGDDKLDVQNNTYTLNNDTTAHKTVSVNFTYQGGGGGGGGSSGYSVNVASTTNGTVTVSPKNASKGATVTVTAKPDKGYVLDTLTVTDKDGKKIDLTDKGDNKFTFVMPAGSVTVKATFKVAPKTPFTDVAESAWYADAVAYVYENGMMKGTSDTKFSPEQTTTRGMIVTILYRLEKEPSASAASFTDVASGKYYSKAVAWASANKIVTGYGDGKFGPNDTITREQMAAILYRYASYKGYDVTKTADLSKFTDASQVGVFAKAAMQWANAEGLINGTSTTKLSPKSGATRAEVATILMRFCENIAK
ncbi:S-layer homology domain-containing protein [Agathobaculum sp. NTUH-O15-33]|uniref:S-layer homology domain-containing protein n=1 Tax=Agathobaculum sp. NTUH-O15-33 TaxID=3079302 RepID=UPI002958A6EE|nr:S-layer homology domain-containing protein [Agathobaculum sp. NTUH-O15-33]WNX86246.1 S-layer homology domain-containing protein [Agathobaculum sp. NTUH-O15-33]